MRLLLVAVAVEVAVVAAATAVLRSLIAARRQVTENSGALAWIGDTSRDWLWEADAELRLTYCSPRVREQLGYHPDDLIGVSMPSLMVPDDEPRARQILAEARAGRTGWRDLEFTWRHADGRSVVLQGSSVPIFDAAGTVVGFRGSRRTVTDAMTAERTLVAARHRITEVLTTSSVDIAWQPIVGLITGRMAGAEALARFRDGRGPATWFAEARETGQSLVLDRLAFFAALATMQRLPVDAYLSVNATPDLLTDSAFRDRLLSGDVDLTRLVVEITEHVEIGRYEDIQAAILPLRERGLRLAVDDTGAGYASFSHVLQLRPDIIKIDRSLVANLADNPARRSLLTALVLLALDLNASVTAEGVETVAELETLANLGIDNAQGYLLARPSTDPRRWRAWTQRHWHQIVPASTRVDITAN
jgi:PAS domain S-box-containing protein